MPIANRNLKASTKLVARYKGAEYRCEVVQTEDGLRYRLPDGKDFKTPSGAGKHVRGGKETNGWDFWSIEGTEPAPKVAKTEEAQSTGFRRIPGGRAWCNACAAAFKVEAGTAPTTCPEGHTPA